MSTPQTEEDFSHYGKKSWNRSNECNVEHKFVPKYNPDETSSEYQGYLPFLMNQLGKQQLGMKEIYSNNTIMRASMAFIVKIVKS